MTVIALALVVVGAVVMLLGAVGLVRLPDVLARANAATKAATLGVGSVLAGSALLADNGVTGLKLAVAALLLLVTSPVAGHLIGRAAHRAGAPLWEGTVADDLSATRNGVRGDTTGHGSPR
jgi:multicomponent Na+:H+ antiporter subunit G